MAKTPARPGSRVAKKPSAKKAPPGFGFAAAKKAPAKKAIAKKR